MDGETRTTKDGRTIQRVWANSSAELQQIVVRELPQNPDLFVDVFNEVDGEDNAFSYSPALDNSPIVGEIIGAWVYSECYLSSR